MMNSAIIRQDNDGNQKQRVLTPSLAQSQAALCVPLGHSLDSVSLKAALRELSVEAAKANPAWWSRGDPWFPGPGGGRCPSAPCPGERELNLMLRFHLPQSVADGGPSFQARAPVGISEAASRVAVLPAIFTKTHRPFLLQFPDL